MTSCSVTQVMNSVLLGAERLHRLPEVREHEQQPRRPVLDRLVEQHQLVLAEHALGQVADARRPTSALSTTPIADLRPPA